MCGSVALPGMWSKATVMNVREISSTLAGHYAATFARHGATSAGVDWGEQQDNHLLRLKKMLRLVELGPAPGQAASILDAGCGYGALCDELVSAYPRLEYTGIDLCPEMVACGQKRHPRSRWIVGDLIDIQGNERFDYVVANGVFTQKLGTSTDSMEAYLRTQVTTMFRLARIGIAFNVMTSYVNFRAPNLFYADPADLFSWCSKHLSPVVCIDQSSRLFDVFVYVLRDNAVGRPPVSLLRP